ncbi:MAG: hypothetical protein NC548_38545 [Lachnospiraceae bacterium]|nr:hypothetical protein [Lachnospiraceae bacterium]
MITTEEIATKVWQMLQQSDVKTMISGVIDYERNDYTKEDVIIVPHTITGEDSLRFGQINVNIHVPDLPKKVNGKTIFRTHFKRLIEIRSKAIEVLQNHYERGAGYNWTVGLINPPIKEPEHDEHFVSFALELTVVDKRTI